MSKPDETLDRFWDVPLRGLLDLLEATPAGLTSAGGEAATASPWPEQPGGEAPFAALIGFLRFFANPLVLILLAASAISIVLRDPVGGTIIIAIVLLSVVVNFYVEFQARHAVEDIRKQVATTAAVLRDGQELELPIAELVPGDIIRLNAGDLAPADARLLDARDLHVRGSALTGESLSVDKAADDLPVQTGIGAAVIIRTGKDTAFGEIAQRLAIAAAGDRIRPRNTPLRADDHASDHAARALRPAGEHCLASSACRRSKTSAAWRFSAATRRGP